MRPGGGGNETRESRRMKRISAIRQAFIVLYAPYMRGTIAKVVPTGIFLSKKSFPVPLRLPNRYFRRRKQELIPNVMLNRGSNVNFIDHGSLYRN